jgi:cephalosporin-C deacetylase-like acetyl esterase
MKKGWVLIGILTLCAAARATDAAEITIPAVSGSFTIDGKLDDAIWQGARVLRLSSSDDSLVPGGEVRIATRGNYLCLGARLSEPDRVVAHSTGRNPTWWAEDVVIWNLRVHSSAGRNLNLSLIVNPFGAYELKGSDTIQVLVAAITGPHEWTLEAAIPIEALGRSGFIHVQRVRALRPDAPQLQWDWPASNENATFELAALTKAEAPAAVPVHFSNPSHAKTERPPELSWIPDYAWTETQLNQIQPPRMLEVSLRKRMAAVAEKEKAAWRQVDSREGWERFRDLRLATLRDWMGPMPERAPLRTAVTRTADYGDGFTIENLVFESRPHLLVNANLYRPSHVSGKIPAIIVVHSHHAPKTQSELQDLGMTWARSGTAVLIMDQLCAGERSQSQPWPRESYYGRYAIGNQLLLAGESLMKWMVWDLMRGIDVLLERPDIDPARVILLGAVAGGGDPAAVTAALDQRVAAVIPFNFGEAGPEEHYTLGPRAYDFDTAWPGWGEWEATRSLPRSAVDQFFPWFLCASVAPRPFLYSFEIAWPADVEHEPAWARYKKVFQLYGRPDHLGEVHGFGPFPGPGECTNVGVLLRKRIYPVLKRWFNMPVPAAEYHETLPDAALMCMTPAVAAERHPQPASALALEMTRSGISRSADLKAELRRKLGDIEPRQTPSTTLLWNRTARGIAVQAIAIDSELGITLPVYVLKPAGGISSRLPVVAGIAQAGKAQFLSQRGTEVVTLLQSGVAVCLPDVRGIGELAPTSSRGPGAMDLAATEFMLGETLPGAQLKDLRTVVRYLASRPDIDPQRIAVWGDSFAETNGPEFQFDQSEMQENGPIAQQQAEPLGPLLALLAGLYEDRVAAVVARGGLVSFRSVLEDRFAHIPQDVIVPGILKVADIPEILEALKPRPVLVDRVVDGRNRPVDPGARERDPAKWLVAQIAAQ